MTVSQFELARELGLSTRRVRQLEDLGVIIAERRGEYARHLNADRYRIFADRDPRALDRLADHMGELASKLDRAIAALDRRFSLTKWEAAARLVTELDREWSLSVAMRPEGERPMLGFVRETTIGDIREHLLHLAIVADVIVDGAAA